MVIYAILINLAALVAKVAIGPAFALLILVSLGLSLFRVCQLSSGLGMSTPMKIIVFVCMFIPLVSLITLLVLNSKATTALRAAGYRVGLLGASK